LLWVAHVTWGRNHGVARTGQFIDYRSEPVVGQVVDGDAGTAAQKSLYGAQANARGATRD
jgi:hypothetical protein